MFKISSLLFNTDNKVIAHLAISILFSFAIAGHVSAELVSVNQAGDASGNGDSLDPHITPDGRYIGFTSVAQDLVANDTNMLQDVFLRDRQSGTTTLISVSTAGAQSNAVSIFEDGSLSDDGRFAVFESTATNLVANDANGMPDIFLRDTVNNTTALVSVNLAGTGSGNGLSEAPQISADGRYVVFFSEASDLVANDTNGNLDVFVHDIQLGTTTLASAINGSTDGGNGESDEAEISSDGRYVFFSSESTNLTADADNNGGFDIFRRDLQTNTTVLVSVSTAGNSTGDAPTFEHDRISPDGRYVVFTSGASDLVANDANALEDIFVRDMNLNTTTLVSINAAGTGSGNGTSVDSAITADGQLVVFSSVATDLVAGSIVGSQIYLRNLQAGTTTLVSAISGTANGGNGASSDPSITPDGRYAVFQSVANDLVANDNNGSASDSFVHDLQSGITALTSRNISGTSGNGGTAETLITPDGRYIALISTATDFDTIADANGVSDVFVFANRLLPSGPIVSATLPGSRSVQVGSIATAFATIINSGADTANGCGITLLSPIASTFSYEATDAMNNPVGAADTPVDIPGNNGVQNYIISFTPSAPFVPTDVMLEYNCINTDAASNTVGLNTILLAADANPVPDVIGLTTVVDLPITIGNTALFAVGSANVGATGDITVSLDDNMQGLPLSMNICQTDMGGMCMSPPSPTVTLNYTAATTASFAIFVDASGAIPFDPANNRIFIRFTDTGGTVRGATSTAVRTL